MILPDIYGLRGIKTFVVPIFWYVVFVVEGWGGGRGDLPVHQIESLIEILIKINQNGKRSS